jgi:hypothetical protein
MKKGLIFSFVLLIAAFVFAGGFQISVEAGKSRSAALIVKTFGCHTPSDAELKGVAEGIVNGERKSVKLNFKHDKKGIFSVAKQWSDEGVWVVVIKGKYNGMISNAVVEIDSESNSKLAGGNFPEDMRVKIVHKNITSAEVNNLLKKLNESIAGV